MRISPESILYIKAKQKTLLFSLGFHITSMIKAMNA